MHDEVAYHDDQVLKLKRMRSHASCTMTQVSTTPTFEKFISSILEMRDAVTASGNDGNLKLARLRGFDGTPTPEMYLSSSDRVRGKEIQRNGQASKEMCTRKTLTDLIYFHKCRI